MAIHDAGMFTVKGINRLKIFRMPSTAIYIPVRLLRCSALRHAIADGC